MDESKIWHQIAKVFYEAVELGPTARSQFLDKACGGNAKLRREVESLLARTDKQGLLGKPAFDVLRGHLARRNFFGCE